MLNSEGLLRYVDSRGIQREVSEAAGISEEEMDELAHELLYMRQDDVSAATQSYQTRGGSAAIIPRSSTYRGCHITCRSADDCGRRKSEERDVEASVTATTMRSKTRPPFYEHLGGYGMDELKDYNEYSKRSSTVVARVARRLPCLRDQGGSVTNSSDDVNGDGRTRVEPQEHSCRHGLSEPLPPPCGRTTTPWTASRHDGHDPLLRRHLGNRIPRPTRTEYQRRPVDDSNEQTDETTMYITSL